MVYELTFEQLYAENLALQEALHKSERLRVAVEEALEHEISSGDEHVDVRPVGENSSLVQVPCTVNGGIRSQT